MRSKTIFCGLVFGVLGGALLTGSGCASRSKAVSASAVNHIVLLNLGDETSSATIDEVLSECRAFPQKIPGITGYQSGANNSPENLNRGLSHGLLMTFENQAALDAYGPHPVHQAFVSFAKPHFQDVFVFDFPVLQPPPGKPGNVQHLVFFRFNPAVTEQTLEEAQRRFAALPDKIPGLLHYQAGALSGDPERAKNLTHGYVLTFADVAARDAYIQHPAHQEFVVFIEPLLASILVLDFTVSDASR